MMATTTAKPETTNGDAPFVPNVPRPAAKLAETSQEAYGRATLAAKLAAISAEIGTIPKNGHNDHFNYDYVTDSDVADALRMKMAKLGVAMIPRVRVVQSRPVTTSRDRETFITEVVAELDFICTETGTMFTVEMPGAGEDGLDKGCYKGTTGAIKYALLKAFNISTGDDPERAEQRSDGSRSSGGRDDRPITDKQRAVIFGKARGYDIDKALIPRIIRYATKGRLRDADAVQTNGQLDYVLGQLLAFSKQPDAALAAIEKYELESGSAAEQAASGEPELPVGDFAGQTDAPPFEGGGVGGDEDIPFAASVA